LSRGLDLAERIPEIDARRNIVTGYSRLAKAALVAAARDERFTVCAPVQTGGGGCPLAKRDFGENISTECLYFSHWYCDAYAKYAAEPWKTMPFDQHLFLAAIAPRALLICGYDTSKWFDTEGEYLAAKAASPAWKLHGLQGLPDVAYPGNYETSAIGDRLGYVRRSEGHGISGYDWQWMLDFAERNFAGSTGAHLFLAGDSTLDDYGRRHRSGRAPLASWGATLQGKMHSGSLVRTFAKSGASTKSFIANGHWGRLIEAVRPGDFVLIQFGHNDQKQATEEQRKVLFAAADGLYRENLRKFAAEVRAKGATPIFCTPIVRATFDKTGKKLVDTTWRSGENCLGSYVRAVIETGKELGVDVVDMNAMTNELCERIGRDEAYKFYAISTGIEFSRDGEPSKDVTHPVPAGAQAYSELFLGDVRKRRLPIADLFQR
jgi:DNA sulfur modification protein DndE